MLLVEGIAMHRGPLSASLMAVYGIRLDDTEIRAVELANLVEHLPAGCAFWQSFGGPLAWSDTDHFLSRVEFRLRELLRQNAGKGERPEPMKPPPLASQAEHESVAMSRVQEKFNARFGK